MWTDCWRNTAVRNTITFIDRGSPYDPLAKEDPDLDAEVEDRKVGGLGIFMVRSCMDDIKYEYKNGQNRLTIRKSLKEPGSAEKTV